MASLCINGREQIVDVLEEIKILTKDIKDKEKRLRSLMKKVENTATLGICNEQEDTNEMKTAINYNIEQKRPISGVIGMRQCDIARYSRQLILPELGVEGQKKLRNASVLIVGAGGLGCPSACYLASAGVGTIGIIDYDQVEVNNLHRQVMHSDSRLGCSKAVSLCLSLSSLNPSITCQPYQLQLTKDNALALMSQYDVVLDCTDNLASRYLVNDACVLLQKALVSGSALRMEGMLCLYNYDGGPCYRCLFPKPPPPETVTNCSDGGVLGTVPGVIGVLQAMEAIKIITGLPVRYNKYMLLYDGLEGRFRDIKLRSKSKECVVCGENAEVTGLIDYTQFCGAAPHDKTHAANLLGADDRISAKRYNEEVLGGGVRHVLVDVRPEGEYSICSLKNSINIPLAEIKKQSDVVDRLMQEERRAMYVLCHHGNDSQQAVLLLRKLVGTCKIPIKDIIGGINSWALQVDPDFPVY